MGMVRSITGLILPWAYHCASCPIIAALLRGSRRAKSPQNTPTIDAPLSRARFQGSAEMAPAPGDGAKGRLGQVAADRVVDHLRALAVGQRLDGFAQIVLAVVDAGI